jgi:hypothetical protein
LAFSYPYKRILSLVIDKPIQKNILVGLVCLTQNFYLSFQISKMSTSDRLNSELSTHTPPFGLRLWVVIGISVCMLILLILTFLCMWAMFRRRSRTTFTFDKVPISQIPDISKEISVDRVGGSHHSLAQTLQTNHDTHYYPDSHNSNFNNSSSGKNNNSGKMLAHLARSKSSDADNLSQCSSVYHFGSGDESGSGPARKQNYQHAVVSASPLVGLPEFSHLGWGHWFTLRDLEHATNRFCKENVIGEGGYGVVYRGRLINGTEVAIKKLLNNL